jgi:hypothetical protein
MASPPPGIKEAEDYQKCWFGLNRTCRSNFAAWAEFLEGETGTFCKKCEELSFGSLYNRIHGVTIPKRLETRRYNPANYLAGLPQHRRQDALSAAIRLQQKKEDKLQGTHFLAYALGRRSC